jgi:hypothetical protein
MLSWFGTSKLGRYAEEQLLVSDFNMGIKSEGQSIYLRAKLTKGILQDNHLARFRTCRGHGNTGSRRDLLPLQTHHLSLVSPRPPHNPHNMKSYSARSYQARSAQLFDKWDQVVCINPGKSVHRQKETGIVR